MIHRMYLLKAMSTRSAMWIRHISLSFAACVLLITSTSAQKFGYLNSAELIEFHPRIDSANQVLETYKDSLAAPYEEQVRAFQSRYQFFVEEMQAGTLSKVTAQNRQAELAKEQEDLKAIDSQLQFQLMQKREKLLQPILNEVDAVIQAIGREGQYTMIFDTSVNGGLLYAIESDDLTVIAKERLAGI